MIRTGLGGQPSSRHRKRDSRSLGCESDIEWYPENFKSRAERRLNEATSETTKLLGSLKLRRRLD